jgi:hypothetical protein
MRHFKNLAILVKQKRMAHPQKYSQAELSDLLGYKNGQFISNVERSLCHLPFKILPKVCEVLNINGVEIKDAMLKDYAETIEYYLSQSPKTHIIKDSDETMTTWATDANMENNVTH